MATSKEFVDFIVGQLSELNEIAVRSMMGEYIVYYKGKIAAYICDNKLLIKPVPKAFELMPDAPLVPPYAGAKEMLLLKDVEDKECITELFAAIYGELPEPAKKKKKK